MIFVTGPAYAGKQECICGLLGISEEEFARLGIRDAEELVRGEEDMETLAERLGRYEIVIMTETGGGIVPVDAADRVIREKAGRLSCLLAKQADTVVRVVCGLPRVLKGDLQT